jgi:stress response protein YsnF
MKKETASDEVRIPVAEERLTVGKKVVETGRVRLRNRVDEEDHRILETLAQEKVRIERVPRDLILGEPPEMREEADRLIVPVFEEVVVKRYRITEEVHLITERSEQSYDETVTLRRNRIEVERD